MASRRSTPEAGSRPGTLAIPADSPAPRIFAIQYCAPAAQTPREVQLPELRSLAEAERTGVLWVDVQGLGSEPVLREIASIFGIHPLALENAVNIPSRAKSEIYGEQHLIIGRLPQPMASKGAPPIPVQVCMLLGTDYVITFQERFFGFFDPVRTRIQQGAGPLRSSGPDYLVYALLDTLVDRYFPLAEALLARLDELEDDISQDAHPDLLQEVYAIRRHTSVIRRVGRPQREAIASLLRDDSPFVGKAARSYLRDTYDHMVQILDLVDGAHDSATVLVELYLSQVSFKTNEIMKVLTLMASLFIPLTFIAGIYGMNFENMPELRQPLGYAGVLAVMAVMAVSMLAYFWHRGWLGSSRRGRRGATTAGERPGA